MSTVSNATEVERAYYSLNARVYARFAPFYDIVASPAWRVRRKVASLAGAGSGLKVLDVATGTGAQALAFAKTGAEVVGVDLSKAMLRRARKKDRLRKVRFKEADATALPFSDGAFDVSCVSFALHEMPAGIRREVVSELARVTRPGGTVVLVDYRLPQNAAARWLVYHSVKLYERDHYADFVRSDVRGLLRASGIDVNVERRALLGIARIVIGTKRA